MVDPKTGIDDGRPEPSILAQIAAGMGTLPGVSQLAAPIGYLARVANAPSSTPATPLPTLPQEPAPQPLPLSPTSPATVPGLPVGSKQVESSDTTRTESRPVVTKEEKASYAKNTSELEQEKANATKLAEKNAGVTGEAADKNLGIANYYAEQRDKLVSQGNAALEKATADRKAAEEAWRGATPEDFFGGDKGGARRFAAGIAVALGGFSAGLRGGPNQAYEIIKDSIDRHDRSERERINKLKDTIGQKEKGEEFAISAKQRALSDLDAKRKAMFEKADAEIASRKAAVGGSPEAIANDPTRMLVQREIAAIDQHHFDSTRAHITKQVVERAQAITGPAAGADKPVGKGDAPQNKAEGFAMRAKKASDEMEANRYSPADLRAIKLAATIEAGGKLTRGAADALLGTTYQRLSPAGKKRFNATSEFIVSGLRPESGAAISASELADAEQRYGTVPGDTADTDVQKRAFRNSKIAELGIQSGRPNYWIETTGAYGGQGSPAAPVMKGLGDKAKAMADANEMKKIIDSARPDDPRLPAMKSALQRMQQLGQ